MLLLNNIEFSSLSTPLFISLKTSKPLLRYALLKSDLIFKNLSSNIIIRSDDIPRGESGTYTLCIIELHKSLFKICFDFHLHSHVYELIINRNGGKIKVGILPEMWEIGCHGNRAISFFQKCEKLVAMATEQSAFSGCPHKYIYFYSWILYNMIS
jgi:hypothetical protein